MNRSARSDWSLLVDMAAVTFILCAVLAVLCAIVGGP